MRHIPTPSHLPFPPKKDGVHGLLTTFLCLLGFWGLLKGRSASVGRKAYMIEEKEVCTVAAPHQTKPGKEMGEMGEMGEMLILGLPPKVDELLEPDLAIVVHVKVVEGLLELPLVERVAERRAEL